MYMARSVLVQIVRIANTGKYKKKIEIREILIMDYGSSNFIKEACLFIAIASIVLTLISKVLGIF